MAPRKKKVEVHVPEEKVPTVTVKLYMTNPYTNQRFFKGDSGVKVVIDSWVEGQIAAGLLVID